MNEFKFVPSLFQRAVLENQQNIDSVSVHLAGQAGQLSNHAQLLAVDVDFKTGHVGA